MLDNYLAGIVYFVSRCLFFIYGGGADLVTQTSKRGRMVQLSLSHYSTVINALF